MCRESPPGWRPLLPWLPQLSTSTVAHRQQQDELPLLATRWSPWPQCGPRSAIDPSLSRLPPATICCGQGKTDTQLSNSSQFLLCIGTDIPKLRVRPSAVVEPCDVSDDIVSRLLTRGVSPLRRPCAFSAAKASLGSGLIETLALATPTPDDPLGSQQVVRRVTGVWTAAIRMRPPPCCGMTPSQRPLERTLHHRCLVPTTHRPPHPLPRRHVQPR